MNTQAFSTPHNPLEELSLDLNPPAEQSAEPQSIESTMQALVCAAREAVAFLKHAHRKAQNSYGDFPEGMLDTAHDLHRAIGAFTIAELAEDGMVAAVESGRDCDGVEYSGKVCVIEATLAAFDKLHDDTAEWADGPFRFDLMRVSEAKKVEYESRDLVMEAHEDGHRHVIYSQYP